LRVSSWVHSAAQKHPERLAIEGPERSLTYAELLRCSLATAGALRRAGLRPGERVGLALPGPEEFVIALHGCMLGGHPAVPVDLRLSGAERAVRLAGVSAVVNEPLRGPESGPPAKSVRGDQVLAVMHTSGTTAAPKPVELSCENFLASALGSAVALGLDPFERWLCPMPLTHVGGLSVPVRSSIYATTAVLPGRFQTEAVLAELMDPARRISLVSLVPTMLARLLDAGLQRPPALRWALLGGGPIPAALLERAAAAGVPVAPTYGMTEACSQIATHGWPLPGAQIAIREGEVLVQGAMVSAAALHPDGWLHTGDLGEIDARGCLRIVGRVADTIVTGGENVAPAEVEAALMAHPAVADAAVFGRPDPEWGEAVTARVVLHSGARAEVAELRSHCAARLAQFKVPKAFAFAERLPRTETGKLLRRELDRDID
jgi:O-succinylbenzoic acid--CoA ligase